MTTSTKPNLWLSRAIEGAILVLALALGLLVRSAWLETAIVTSGSMEPTLKIGQRLLIDHRQSLRGNWQRGDMVIFEAPENWGGSDTLIKRVIGLPGETVAIEGGVVSINGVALKENYIVETPKPEEMLPLQLQPGEFWVMGDNRNNSDDSRTNGPLPPNAIVGRATYSLSPWGALHKADYN